MYLTNWLVSLADWPSAVNQVRLRESAGRKISTGSLAGLYKFFISSLLQFAPMKVSLVAILLLPLTLPAASQAQKAKPNLSGTWIFSAQKSSLKMPAPSSMTLQIAQNDPQINFSRSQVYGERTFDWKLEAVTDGQKEVVQKSPDYTANIRVYWEGDSLVLDQKITAPDGTQANDMVTYSLADSGNLLQAVERQTTVGGKGSTTNKWVYEKRAQ